MIASGICSSEVICNIEEVDFFFYFIFFVMIDECLNNKKEGWIFTGQIDLVLGIFNSE